MKLSQSDNGPLVMDMLKILFLVRSRACLPPPLSLYLHARNTCIGDPIHILIAQMTFEIGIFYAFCVYKFRFHWICLVNFDPEMRLH